jgi:glycosyltransferase involved in cell wall biosynthesis
MKTICILLQNHYDYDIRVRRKAEALVASGYSVDVLALRAPAGPKTYTLGGVRVHTISLGKKRGSLLRYVFEYLAFFLWTLVRVTAQMVSRRYAIVDVNTLPDFLVFAPVFTRMMGAKIVLDLHEITPEFYMSKYGLPENSPFVKLMKFLEKISFNFADHVITINEPIQDLLASRGLSPAKSTVITNAADEAKFVSEVRTCAAADAAKAPGTFVMIYHGTLTRLYGLDIAIEAFALALPQMTDAELWILGSGPEAASLRSLAQTRGLQSKVRLFGLISPADIPAWLRKCDVGVLPIRRDAFLDFASPNKLAEYIIMGMPVVISRLKATRHYFSEDALAYFAPQNPADLAAQMVRLCGDPELRQSLARRAKQEYAPISWEVMRDRYLALVATMIGPAGTAAEPSQMVTAARSKS